MKNVKDFFQEFKQSLIPTYEYYSSLVKKHHSHSLRYFIFLILFVVLVGTTRFLIIMNPFTLKAVFRGIQNELTTVPRNLTIDINHGNLVTTLDRPFFFWLQTDQKNTSLVTVIDETASPNKINIYHSISMITKKDLVIHTDQGDRFIVLPLSFLPSMKITNQTITSIHDQIATLTNIIPFTYIIVGILFFVFLLAVSLVSVLMYIFIASVVNFILFTFLMRERFGHTLTHMNFRKTTQLALHAATLPLILDYLISLPPPLFLLLLCIFVFGGIYEGYLDRKIHSRFATIRS